MARPNTKLVLSAWLLGAACTPPRRAPPPEAPTHSLPAATAPAPVTAPSDTLVTILIVRDYVRMLECGHDGAVGDLHCGYGVAGDERPVQPAARLRVMLTEPPGLLLAATEWEPSRVIGDAVAVRAECEIERRGELAEVHLGAAPNVMGYWQGHTLPVARVSACTFAPYPELPQRLRAAHLVIAHAGARGAAPTITRSRAEAEARAREAAARLDAGAISFAAAVREYSDEAGAASREGDLGPFMAASMAPEFTLRVRATPVGHRSPPFESAFGFHLLERREE